MSSGRDIFFTLADEAAFSELLVEKYLNAVFAADEHPSRANFRTFPSIDRADCSMLWIFVPNQNWQPTLEPGGFHGMYKVVNQPELTMHFIRSSNGWASADLMPDGEPRWVTGGGCGVIYHPRPSKIQKAFRDRVWRIFPKIATWKLFAYNSKTRRRVSWEKTDKIVWAGNDAMRWARENRLRRFTGKNVIYGPPTP
jgi:hypothetical protein